MKRLITAFVVAAMCATGGAAFAQTAKSKPATKTEQASKASCPRAPYLPRPRHPRFNQRETRPVPGVDSAGLVFRGDLSAVRPGVREARHDPS